MMSFAPCKNAIKVARIRRFPQEIDCVHKHRNLTVGNCVSIAKHINLGTSFSNLMKVVVLGESFRGEKKANIRHSICTLSVTAKTMVLELHHRC